MRTIQEIIGNHSLQEFLVLSHLDFKIWYERVLNYNQYGGLKDYMKEWFILAQNYDRLIIEAPSGFAKTTVLGVAYPLWLLFFYPNMKILLISKTLTQSKDALLSQIREHIENNELLISLMPKDKESSWNLHQLKTSNGGIVYNRPYSINLKSYRADVIICDELDSYEDPNIFFDYVISRLNPKGKLIGITTPESQTGILGKLKAMNKGEWMIKKYPAIVNEYGEEMKGDLSKGRSIWEERFPISLLMKRKEEMGEQFFMKNYMLNPNTESQRAIYHLSEVSKGFDISRKFTSKSEGGDIVIGCDFAVSNSPTADYDAFVVVEKVGNNIIIKHIETHKGIPTDAKIRRIIELYNLFSPIRVVVDESGIGKTIRDELIIAGVPVVLQSFQYKARNEILMNLKNVIDSGKLIIPRANHGNTLLYTDELIDQLIGFEEKESPITKTRQYVSTTKHDDIVMALAMAVKEVSKLKSSLDFPILSA